MKKKPGVMIYFELRAMLKLLSDSEKGKLFEAIRSTGGLISKKAFIQTLCSRYADPSAFTRGSGMMFAECMPLVIEYGLPLHAIRSTQLFLLTVKLSSLPQEEVAKMLRLLCIDGARRGPEILSQAARSGVREYLLITLAMGHLYLYRAHGDGEHH